MLQTRYVIKYFIVQYLIMRKVKKLRKVCINVWTAAAAADEAQEENFVRLWIAGIDHGY